MYSIEGVNLLAKSLTLEAGAVIDGSDTVLSSFALLPLIVIAFLIFYYFRSSLV